MIAIVFAIVALVGWGTADIFGGLVARKIGGYSSALWSYILSIVIASIYIPFALSDLQRINIETIIWLLLLIPIGVVPLITLYEGIKAGNASLVGTVAGSFGVLTVLLSVIFFGEKLQLWQTVAVTGIILGVILSSLNIKTFALKGLLFDKGIPFALISFFTWGIYFTFIKIPIQTIGWFWPAYLSWWGFPLVLLFMKKRNFKVEIPKDNKYRGYMIINAIILTIALFAYNVATGSGQTAIVAPIASSYPALFAILAYFVFKDRLTKTQILGVIITLINIVVLSVVS